MKLGLEFVRTKTEHDFIEGDWRVTESDTSTCPRYMLREFIRHDILCDDKIDEDWNIESAKEMNRLERKLQVALFTENGRFANDDCNHGTFIAWKDGVPA